MCGYFNSSSNKLRKYTLEFVHSKKLSNFHVKMLANLMQIKKHSMKFLSFENPSSN